MWIYGLIILIGGLLTIFAVPRIKDNDTRNWVQFIVLISVTLGVSLILTLHPEPITNIVESYQKGQIVKCETITVEGTDTVKITKYKYK
jgi:uncharacterized membrane protein YqgA involved in biofilm formation